MCSKVLKCLIGAVFILSQLQSYGCSATSSKVNVYIAELMVESNVTLEAQTVLSILNSTTDLAVTDQHGNSIPVVILDSQVAADCLIIGETFSCNCSKGFVWSNEVCDACQCCRDTTCKKNVSYIAPLCIPEVKVMINGTVTLTTSPSVWDATKTTIQTEVEKMNGLVSFNITEIRDLSVYFEAVVSVKFKSARLQKVVEEMEASLSNPVIFVDTLGMVTMKPPGNNSKPVEYGSTVEFCCTYEEDAHSAGWNMSRPNERFELNNGTVVTVSDMCTSGRSCAALTIQNAIGLWEGTYECGFMWKAVRHIAKAHLSVALLPDEISLIIDPLTVDCEKSPSVDVNVTATIQNSTEPFVVWWSYNGKRKDDLRNTSLNGSLVYSFKATIKCDRTSEAQYVNVTFENRASQSKSARVDIPVIYAGDKFCKEEVTEDGLTWPKSPGKDTVIIRTCPEGRVGYKSRTCGGTTWEDVFSYCIKEELNKVFNEADKFRMGLGATQAVAMDIFEGLKNSSSFSSESGDATADISASINILGVMADGSTTVALDEQVFPDFVDAASNMLNNSWKGVNDSIVQNMSSAYLLSVEGLVKNIQVKNATTLSRQNLDLQVCTGDDCDVKVFDIGVRLNESSGTMKTVAVKNIMNKLKNNVPKTEPTSLLLSATLEDNAGRPLQIKLDFPIEDDGHRTPLCVFWDTTSNEWSREGCFLNKTNEGNHTSCVCNHLTSFSVLMAKGDISTDILDMITSVGLGVSVCSLLIFLIIEALVWSAVVKSNLSHFRHTAIVNIAVFLLLANCCFLASSYPEKISDYMCLVMTVCKHLFYLAMFSWMLCMSVMLVHQLIFVFSPLRKRVFMFLSSIVGYVCPILIVGCSYVYAKYTDKDYYRRDTCWLVYEKLLDGSIHAFLLPVGTVILTNLFSMVVVIVTLMKSSIPDSKSDEKDAVKSILKVVVFLTPVFGVTWIIGFFLLMMNEDDPLFEVANYSFVILNSFQGLFILITGCIAEQKVREELLKLIMDKSKGKGTSTKNFNSTTYTKDK